jgi:hypothetical protein
VAGASIRAKASRMPELDDDEPAAVIAALKDLGTDVGSSLTSRRVIRFEARRARGAADGAAAVGGRTRGNRSRR